MTRFKAAGIQLALAAAFIPVTSQDIGLRHDLMPGGLFAGERDSDDGAVIERE